MSETPTERSTTVQHSSPDRQTYRVMTHPGHTTHLAHRVNALQRYHALECTGRAVHFESAFVVGDETPIDCKLCLRKIEKADADRQAAAAAHGERSADVFVNRGSGWQQFAVLAWSEASDLCDTATGAVVAVIGGTIVAASAKAQTPRYLATMRSITR